MSVKWEMIYKELEKEAVIFNIHISKIQLEF